MAGHDFDEISPSSHLFPDSAPHLIRSAGLPTNPIGVPSRLDDGCSTDLQSWSRKDSLLHRLFGKEVHFVEPEVPDHGDSRTQALEHVSGSFEGRDGAWVVHGLASQIVNPVPVEVRMTVDEPRHEGSTGFLNRCRARFQTDHPLKTRTLPC